MTIEREKTQNNNSLTFGIKSIRGKLFFYFILVTILLSITSFYTFMNSNFFLSRLDEMFINNVSLDETSMIIKKIDNSMEKYLMMKKKEDLEEYTKTSAILKNRIKKISKKPSQDTIKLYWKNIANLMERYLEYADDAINSKNEKKSSMYYRDYKETQKILEYLNISISELNNAYMVKNTNVYVSVNDKMKELQRANLFVIIAVICIILLIVWGVVTSLTKPIKRFSVQAMEIAGGRFDAEDIKMEFNDEMRELAFAFNKMKHSIREYIEEIQEKSKIEIMLAEQEMQNLKMKNLVKNAKIETLQAQINPHFLFNTLNACIQVANSEDAEKTVDFLYNLSAFFRYNLRNINNMVSLEDEIKNVESYVYLLKIRFSDILNFRTEIDNSVLDLRLPLLTLQPIIENAFFHGINNKENGGTITLKVRKQDEFVEVIVEDDGIGMSLEQIEEIKKKSVAGEEDNEEEEQKKKSSGAGIGLNNVIQRLKINFDREIVFIESEEGKYTRFVLRFPGGEKNI